MTNCEYDSSLLFPPRSNVSLTNSTWYHIIIKKGSEIKTNDYLAHYSRVLLCCRFGLFEAMSAIEMMDPKMDAGMIGNQVNRKVLNFEQAVKVPYFIFNKKLLMLFFHDSETSPVQNDGCLMFNATHRMNASQCSFFKCLYLQDNAIKVRDLSLPELIGIIDTCFCCLV